MARIMAQVGQGTLGMLFDLAQHLAHISLTSLRSPPTEMLPVIYSDILFGILSDVLSDLLSGILSDSSLEILCGRGPAGNALILSLVFGSGGKHCDLAASACS